MKKLLASAVVLCLAVAAPARGAPPESPAKGGDTPGVEELLKQLKNGDVDGRRTAAKSLAEAGAEAKTAVGALTQALKDKDLFVRRFAAQALGVIGPDAEPALPALKNALNDPRKEVQEAAAVAIGKLGRPGVLALMGIAKDGKYDTEIRRKAIESLGMAGSEAKSAVPTLTDLVKGPGPKGKKPADAQADLRLAAVQALGAIATPDDKPALDALTDLTDKKQPRMLRNAATAALRSIKKNK